MANDLYKKRLDKAREENDAIAKAAQEKIIEMDKIEETMVKKKIAQTTEINEYRKRQVGGFRNYSLCFILLPPGHLYG